MKRTKPEIWNKQAELFGEPHEPNSFPSLPEICSHLRMEENGSADLDLLHHRRPEIVEFLIDVIDSWQEHRRADSYEALFDNTVKAMVITTLLMVKQ